MAITPVRHRHISRSSRRRMGARLLRGARSDLKINNIGTASASNASSVTDHGDYTCSPPPHLKVVKTPDGGTFTQGGAVRSEDQQHWHGFGFERFFGDGPWRLHLFATATSQGRQDAGWGNVYSGGRGPI